jgi:hypothetical protein
MSGSFRTFWLMYARGKVVKRQVNAIHADSCDEARTFSGRVNEPRNRTDRAVPDSGLSTGISTGILRAPFLRSNH